MTKETLASLRRGLRFLKEQNHELAAEVARLNNVNMELTDQNVQLRGALDALGRERGTVRVLSSISGAVSQLTSGTVASRTDALVTQLSKANKTMEGLMRALNGAEATLRKAGRARA